MSENSGKPCNGVENESILESVTDLSLFRVTRILGEDVDRKTIFIEAEVKDSDKPAVITLEQLPFSGPQVGALMGPESQSPALNDFINDIYGQFKVRPQPQHNQIKANIVHPASEKHIQKYLSSPPHLIVETPLLYRSVTLPHLDKEQFSLQWVYNVLEHKKEVERIIFEDPDPSVGFILAPDFKWSGEDTSDMYCLAIVHRRGLRSLRDLTGEHLPLLRNIQEKVGEAIREKYGLERSQLRCYLHYQPSYYHLHVHVTSLNFQPPGSGAEKAHLLSSVIANIERAPEYYREATLTYVLREKQTLYASFKDSGYFDPVPSPPLNICQKPMEKEEDIEKTLKFLEMLGKAKHEPCGQFWETSYGESAWRLAILSLCLPDNVDRRRLVCLSLASSLSSVGRSNDENTEWASKVGEVAGVLSAHLPPETAGFLLSLFEEHAAVRRNHLDGSRDHEAYRGVLELEETLLRWEEEVKEGTKEASQVETVFKKALRVGFPGSSQFSLLASPTPLTNLLKFWLEASRLQRLRRTGWVRCGVREPETVAAHMFRVGFMGLLLGGPECAMIGLCHDIAECIIGDITPHCKVSNEEKADREMKAFKTLVKDLPGHIVEDIFGSFLRYEVAKEGDNEAQIIKDLDKFDMILQAWEYEKRDKKGHYLQQFFDSTASVFKTVPVLRWQQNLLSTREGNLVEA